jgi:hypothetical protein
MTLHLLDPGLSLNVTPSLNFNRNLVQVLNRVVPARLKLDPLWAENHPTL